MSKEFKPVDYSDLEDNTDWWISEVEINASPLVFLTVEYEWDKTVKPNAYKKYPMVAKKIYLFSNGVETEIPATIFQNHTKRQGRSVKIRLNRFKKEKG